MSFNKEIKEQLESSDSIENLIAGSVLITSIQGDNIKTINIEEISESDMIEDLEYFMYLDILLLLEYAKSSDELQELIKCFNIISLYFFSNYSNNSYLNIQLRGIGDKIHKLKFGY